MPSSSVDSDICNNNHDGAGTISKAAMDKLWSEWLQFFCLIVNVERNISSADTVGYIGYENVSFSSRFFEVYSSHFPWQQEMFSCFVLLVPVLAPEPVQLFQWHTSSECSWT